MTAMTAHAMPHPVLPAQVRSGLPAERMTSHFFALDTDGRIAWPFRYTWTETGVQAQRWRFGLWVQSSQLTAFMTGADDRYVSATAQEVDAWVRRHSDSWHPIIHAAE
ncbi:MAG: hypothetical protein RLY86_1430 [Pseudomonadota bacterium]|jgi:hypothetical protein